MTDDRTVDRGRPWIRNYLNELLSQPPQGTRTRYHQNGAYPGVAVRDGRIDIEDFAHDDYIRIGVHDLAPETYQRLHSFRHVDVVRRAKRWLTAYVRDSEGLAAIDWLVGRID